MAWRNKLGSAVSAVVSVLFLVLVLRRIEWGALGELVRENPPYGYLSLAMLSILCALCGSTLRWRYILLAQYGVFRSVSFGEMLKAVMIATGLNCVLPSKGGDLAKVLFLRRHMLLSAGVGTVILERMADLAFLALLSVAASLASGIPEGILTGLALLAILLVAFLLIVFPIFEFAWIPHRLADARASVRLVFRQWLAQPRLVLLTCASCALVWSMNGVCISLLMTAFAPGVPFVYGLSIYPIAVLAGLMPVSISGIGVRDAAMVYLLTSYTTPTQAACVALGYTFFAYWFPGLLSIPFCVHEVGRWRNAGK